VRYRDLFLVLCLARPRRAVQADGAGVAWASSSVRHDDRLHLHLQPEATSPARRHAYPVFLYVGLLFWNIFRHPDNAGNFHDGNASLIQKSTSPGSLPDRRHHRGSTLRFRPHPRRHDGLLRSEPHLIGIRIPSSPPGVGIERAGMACCCVANVKYRESASRSFFIQILMYVTPSSTRSGCWTATL